MEIYKETFCCQECYSDITDAVLYNDLEVEYECPYCGANKKSSDTSITIGVPSPYYIMNNGSILYEGREYIDVENIK